ncbi:MAG: UDP-N-acetylglucosamine--N-acetylmuramyl-(pentapeptide) pyrophosphoryl-undecaprenol N-acetylglucosamine transferase, partial [Deltaproteobacteria bacterium]|nr:UDP-N-acetylglucosamine--N-acetylmuramyl-(pentapeptide) pyrophosphoryl-undecaprenol N-acetylglucosamine transferase [Deltaproteobacteria bacterium]
SQGAHFINMEIPGILAEVGARFPLKIVHQTGEADFEAVRELYGKLNLRADVEKFIYNMADCYKDSCLAICRAGAATIGELGTAGLPAFFIPFPHATDNHQFFNAKELAGMGAAFLMEQKDFDRAKAVSWIAEYLGDGELPVRMAGRMREFGEARGDMGAILKEVLSDV